MTYDVVIIGSGFGGLGATHLLAQEGVTNVVMVEKANDVGGTWRDNTYPGCRCDVASNLYSFSFAPNPNWSNSYSFQPEIQRYLQQVAANFDLKKSVLFDHDVSRVRFDVKDSLWHLETNHGEVVGRHVIVAAGGLSAMKKPDIPGLDDFAGPVLHTAAWDSTVSLEGKRVAVIGTGASAIQAIPEIAPLVSHLDVFQRTPSWVLPHLGHPTKTWVRLLYRFFPFAQKIVRTAGYWRRELLAVGFVKQPDKMTEGEKMSRELLEKQVTDPAIREKLTPHYRLGCKRILIANNYYPVFNQPHVSLVTDGISGIEKDGIRTHDGVLHPADVIITATGFHVTDHPMAAKIVGRTGETLAPAFAGSMPSYRGTSFPGFPNLYMLGGPNTALGHSSIIFMHESQLQYIVRAISTSLKKDVLSEPTAVAAETWTSQLRDKLPGTVWNTGCASWYLNEQGLNTTIWPSFTFTFRRALRDYVPSDHLTTPA
jgi:cation diffusion facilitator CzcD-associated flavoprotein CzcO